MKKTSFMILYSGHTLNKTHHTHHCLGYLAQDKSDYELILIPQDVDTQHDA